MRTLTVSLLLLVGAGLIYFFFFNGVTYTNDEFGYSVSVKRPWHLSPDIMTARHAKGYAYVTDFDHESEAAFATEIDAGNAPPTSPDWQHVIEIKPSTVVLCDTKNAYTDIGKVSTRITVGDVTACEVDYRKIENFNTQGLVNTLAVYIPVPFGFDTPGLEQLKSIEISLSNAPIGGYAEGDFLRLVNSFKWLKK